VRVTFLLSGWFRKPIGGARVVYEYANGLAARGHEVTVVHPAFLEPRQYGRRLLLSREPRNVARGVVDMIQGRPTRVSWHTVDPRVELRYTPNLHPRHIPDGDAVVATAWRTAESVTRYPRSKGDRFYLIQSYEIWDAPKARVDATWRAELHKIVIAGWLEDLAADMGVSDVVRIPNGMDHARFRLLQPIEDRPARVCMLYFPSALKGGATGVAALASARRRVPALTATLFGVRARPKGLPSWIDYLHNPAQERLPTEVYNASSVYLCPSLSEGWHLPAVEAMACGCAVVSTDNGGVRDYAEDGTTALLSPPGDAARLADNLVRLLTDDAQRQRIAELGHDAVQQFTWPRSVDRLEERLLLRTAGA
jgi:glycosyltransferase involved in cell wall biosynthesis